MAFLDSLVNVSDFDVLLKASESPAPSMFTRDPCSGLDEFGELCRKVCLPSEYQADALQIWKAVLLSPFDMSQKAIWLACTLHVLINQESVKKLHNWSQIAISTLDLCSVNNIRLYDLIQKLGGFEMMLLGERLPSSLLLERKYCSSLALFVKYTELFHKIFQGSDAEGSDCFRLPWLLFIVARSVKVGLSPTLMDSYGLLLCCIAFSVSLCDAHACQQPFDMMSIFATDGEVAVLEEMCQQLDVSVERCFDLYRSSWSPFRDFLMQVCRNSRKDLIQYVESKYRDMYEQMRDFDEILFLNRDPRLCSAEHFACAPIGKSLPEYRRENWEACLQRSSCSPPARLKDYLHVCTKYSEKKLLSRIGGFRRQFVQGLYKVGVDGNIIDETLDASQKLYLSKMESFFAHEEARLQVKDFSALLNREEFQRSLFCACAEAILWSNERTASARMIAFPWVLDVFGVSAYNFHMVLEQFVLIPPYLPIGVCEHISKLEVETLTSLVWREDAAVQMLRDSKLEEATFALETFPWEIPVDDLKLSYACAYFILRVRRVMQSRLGVLCDALQLSDRQLMNTWPCLQHSIFCRTELPCQRHLDQLMLCSVYAIAKILGWEVPFRRILSAYKDARLGDEEIYKRTRGNGATFDSIIVFYNEMFMPSMKDFLLKYGVQIKENENRNVYPSVALQKERVARQYRLLQEELKATT